MAVIDIKYSRLLKNILDKGEVIFDKTRNINLIQIPSYTLDLVESISTPFITTKKLFLDSVLSELEMFLKGETNVGFLLGKKCNIWNKDAYAYYKRICKKNNVKHILDYKSFLDTAEYDYIFGSDTNKTLPVDYTIGDLGPIYGAQWSKNDQLAVLIENIKNRNFNRRLIVDSWNTEELGDMALPPCHWAFEAIQHKDGFILKWHQRSVDTFLGLPFNIASYYILGKLISEITDINFYGLIGDLSNVHIYENHISSVITQLQRSEYNYNNRDIEIDFGLTIKNIIKSINNNNISLAGALKFLNTSRTRIEGYRSYPAIRAEMISPIE